MLSKLIEQLSRGHGASEAEVTQVAALLNLWEKTPPRSCHPQRMRLFVRMRATGWPQRTCPRVPKRWARTYSKG